MWTRTFVVAVLGVGLVAACQGAPAVPSAPVGSGESRSVPAAAPVPAAPATFTLAHLPPAAFQWASYVALAKGFYAAQGLEPDLVQLGSPNEAARAVASGSVQAATFSADAAVRAIEGGGDVIMIGSEIANPAFSLIAQPEIRDYADLRGKAIAVSAPKDGAAVVLRLMLRARGLNEGDYDFVSVGTTPNRYAALKSRGADAAIMTQPIDFVAIDEGYRLLGRSSDVLQDFMFMSVTVNRTWAREQRPVAVRYLRALGAAIDWLYDPANKEEAIDLLAQRTNTERSAAARTYTVFIEEGKVIPRGAAIPVAGLETYLQAMIDLGDLPGPTPNAARYIDLSYGEEARQ